MGVETLPPLKFIYLHIHKITLFDLPLTNLRNSYGKNNRKNSKAIRKNGRYDC